MVLDYSKPPFKPSDEAFEYYNLAVSLGYKEYLQKEFGRSLYYYNQDYRSANNMQHAKEYAIANQQTTTTTTNTNKKGQSVFTSQPTTTLGGVITNIADTIIPSIPEAQAITTGTIPNPVQISVGVTASNSAIVNWSSEDNVNKYHIVLINKDKSQTVREFDISGVPPQTNTTIQNLESGTNYTIYIIAVNRYGNSEETNYKFKTLGLAPVVTTPVVTTPVVTQPIVTAPTITLSSEVQTILTKFDNNDYTYPSWFDKNIGWVKTGDIDSSSFLNSFNSMVQSGIIIDKTIPVEKEYDVTVLRINEFGGVYSELFYGIKGNKLLELESEFLVVLSDKPRPTDQEVRDFYNFVDTSIDVNMVSQSIGAFTLKDGKVTGKIIYIAESAFNPYYYNKPVTSIVQIKDQAGSTIKLKTNNLNFTGSERDETITINEGVGDVNAIKIEFLVWKGINEPIPFTLPKVDEIVAQEIGLKPCPIGQHRNFNNKCVADDQPSIGSKPSVLALFGGVTALIGTLALLGSKRR